MKPWLLLLVGLSTNCFGFTALAEERVALLIGNQNYAPGVGGLTNPHKDIELVGSSLQQLGFNVVSRKDLRRADIMREVSEFIARLSRGGDGAVGFFYYSGHGVSRPSDRFNYLIPVDVTDMQDLNIWWNTIPLETLLNELRTGAPNASHIVVFDACRNELRLPEKTAVKGFEPMGERSGLFIAFSTSPNTAASDRGIDGGHYAQALASELMRPGQDQMHLFQNVKRRVFTATGNTQRPWESNGLLEPLYLAGLPNGPSVPDLRVSPTTPDMAKKVAPPPYIPNPVLPAPTTPLTNDSPAKQAQEACDTEAMKRKLAGFEKRAFISGCISNTAAGNPNASLAEHWKKFCDTEAMERKLAGEAKRVFIKACVNSFR